MIKLSPIEHSLPSDRVFKLCKHFAISFYNYFNQASSGLFGKIALTALPGFYSLRLPRLMCHLKHKSPFAYTLLFLKYIFISYVRPFKPVCHIYSIHAFSRVSNTQKTLVIVLASSYINQNFLRTFQSLLKSLSENQTKHNFGSILFIAHDKLSFEFAQDLLIKNSNNLEVQTDFIELKRSTYLRISLFFTLPFRRIFSLLCILLFTNRLIHRFHALLDLYLSLKTRVLCKYAASFSLQLKKRYNMFTEYPPCILELDNFNPHSSFHALLYAYAFKTSTSVLQWAIYGPEAIEWCGCSCKNIFTFSPYFKNEIRPFFEGRDNVPILHIGNIRHLRVKEIKNFVPSKNLNLLVLGPMDPWKSNNFISLTPLLQNSIQQFAHLLPDLTSTFRYILRPHPLDTNDLLFPLINSINTPESLFLDNSVNPLDALEKADLVISFFPSTLYINALELRIPVVLINKSSLPKWAISWLPSEILYLDNPKAKSFDILLNDTILPILLNENDICDPAYAKNIGYYFGGPPLDLLQQIYSIDP